MTTTEEVLAERGKRYGEFMGHAMITQDLKDLLHFCSKWEKLAHDQKEALEMIMHKVGRIMNGDPDWEDSWRDISGYASLVADRLLKVQEREIKPGPMTWQEADALNSWKILAPKFEIGADVLHRTHTGLERATIKTRHYDEKKGWSYWFDYIQGGATVAPESELELR